MNAPDGRPYYFNEVTRETSWTIPAGASTPPPATSLAPGPGTSHSTIDSGSNVAPSSMYPHHTQPQPHPQPQTSYGNYGQYQGGSHSDQLAQQVKNFQIAPHQQHQQQQHQQGAQQASFYRHGKYTMQSLIEKTSLQQSGTEFFEQERDRLLQINVGTGGESFAWIKNGSMVSCSSHNMDANGLFFSTLSYGIQTYD